MKEKHLKIRMNQCLELAEASNCVRAKFGCLIVDPIRNVILIDGYNGGPRNGTELCGDNCCLRKEQDIPSGTKYEVGCVHAEMNAICNAAERGVEIGNSWIIINGEPCEMCAKLIHHAGICKVIIIDGGFSGPNGLDYLKKNNISVELRDGPKDPRTNNGGN
jgi:dCMP deaminase